MVDITRPPIKAHVILLKVSGGTDNGNDYAYFKNGRTGDKFSVKISNSEASVNLKQLTADGLKTGTHTPWANKDVIQIVVTGGGRRGAVDYVVDSSQGGTTIALTLTDVSTANAPAVSIG